MDHLLHDKEFVLNHASCERGKDSCTVAAKSSREVLIRKLSPERKLMVVTVTQLKQLRDNEDLVIFTA